MNITIIGTGYVGLVTGACLADLGNPGDEDGSADLQYVQALPLTSNTGRLYPSEAVVTVAGQSSKAMADQLTTVAKERLTTRFGVLTEPISKRLNMQ